MYLNNFTPTEQTKMRGPATGKVRVPIVDSLDGGTTRRLVPAERRDY